MDPESGELPKCSWRTTLLLAFQSLGVVYGNLSISPLYVLKSTFAEDITHSETNLEIFGVLSFVFWTLTLIPLLKYVFIVLRADDNGEGGTFALYSSICRHANVSLLPNRQPADEDLSTYSSESPAETKNESKIRNWIEKRKELHTALLIVVLLSTCMVIGDGVLTPAMSVFSAVQGLELYMSKQEHQYAVMPITCAIIICLFMLQHYGTHRIGILFAPIILTWLLCIGALGIFNIVKYDPYIYRALSPYHMFKFLKKTKAGGWKSLGGVLLCITGSEAMFADLGHFSYTVIQIAFTALVYPTLILAYMGQAAYLSKHHQIDTSYNIGFYASVPDSVRWPVLVLAILASIAGSQAIISGTFSIINQSHSLGCFPRIKVVHTSKKIHGQMYIPEINWILMLLCVAVAFGLRDTKQISNASGLAGMTVMMVTTCLTSLVMILQWQKPALVALTFLVLFGSIEAFYFSASVAKFCEGAWLPILLAFIFMTIMFVWHYATIKKYEFDLHNKVSLDWLLTLGESLGAARVPGIGLVYTDVITGVPSNFSHLVTNLPAFHQILVFVCIKYVPVPFVPPAERYLIGRVGPHDHRSYRCIVRYGYCDVHQDIDSFETELVGSLAEVIEMSHKNYHLTESADSSSGGHLAVIRSPMFSESNKSTSSPIVLSANGDQKKIKKVRFVIEDQHDIKMDPEIREELEQLHDAQEAGTTFILGQPHLRAKAGSSIVKKLAINFVYNFLRRNCRGPDVALRVPPASLLEVGTVYAL